MLSFPYIQRGLLFTQPILPSSDLLNLLRCSLSLSFYPPLAGRLSTNRDGSFFVACNDAGVEFVDAAAPGLSLADVAARNSSDVPDVVKELFLLDGVVGFDGCSSPLAAVQVTELANGAFVGCSVSQAVVNGASFWNFIRACSELCRGVEKISWPPDFNRDLLKDSPQVQCLPPVGRSIPTATSKTREFHFSREAIQDLKARANSLAGAMEGGEISSFQSLCSQVWRSVTRARNPSPGNRMEPPLGTHYFGNAILPIITAAKAEEVVGRELGLCTAMSRRLGTRR